MLIKYSNISILKKLFKDRMVYSYWFNILTCNFKFSSNIKKIAFNKLNIILYRFFFWFFYVNIKKLNFLIFISQFKFLLIFCNLLTYLKNNNIFFYNIHEISVNLLNKKISFYLPNKNLNIIFIYNKSHIVSNKLYYINFLDFNLVKIFLYFLK